MKLALPQFERAGGLAVAIAFEHLSPNGRYDGPPNLIGLISTDGGPTDAGDWIEELVLDPVIEFGHEAGFWFGHSCPFRQH